MAERVDIAIVGGGAAGLMAGIWAARAGSSVLVLDGARTIGAKILVAGGGRCNVTHHEVSERDFAGSSRHSIKKVLRRFEVRDTISFFEALGVRLKREPTGKLFPTTDKARTVLNALLGALRDAGGELRFPWRVESLRCVDGGFVVGGAAGVIEATCVVLATGGKSLPRTGSDGFGYEIARSLGHTTTEDIFPALVPLAIGQWRGKPHFVRELSGVSTEARVDVRSGTGKRLASFTGSVLCTHFGLSGPAILDISRYLKSASLADAGALLHVGWLADQSRESADVMLRELGATRLDRMLRDAGLPERLASSICVSAGVDPKTSGSQLRKAERADLASALTEMRVPVAGDRGWKFAEVTAGGVPLGEVDVATMASRACPGLHLCGEILDVDGRIGGFNFQWAWASGYVAGRAAAGG